MTTTSITLSALWILFALYWIISMWGNKPTRSKKFTVMGGMMGRIIMYGIIVILWVVPWFGKHIFVPQLSLRLVGIAFCVGGLAFAIWARRTLGGNWNSNPTEVKVGHELITAGPYRLVRHPIYSGIIFSLLGTLLATGTTRVLILFIIVAIGMPIRALFEERLMTKQFPETYPSYRKQSNFLLPWLW